MQILIHKNGQQLGPFPEVKVAEMLKAGQVAGSDLAWSEGMETWKPLATFALSQNLGLLPPPVPGQTPPLISERRTEPLSIWALVLGIVSIVGCSLGGFLASIPAVICGHIGLSRIKKDPTLDGKGMALAGLITGYIGLLVLPMILLGIALPAIFAAKERAKDTQMLSNMRQIQLAIQMAQVDGQTESKPGLGFPADAKLTSTADVKNMLVTGKYLTADDLARFQFERISVGNVSDDDPADTILLKCEPETGKSAVVILKSGEGKIVRPGQSFGQDPPRNPAYLK